MWPLAVWVPGHAFISATFGRHLDFGAIRRISLSMALTLVAYPLIALTGMVLGLRLTHALVVVGTFSVCAASAAIIHRRDRREGSAGENAIDAGAAGDGRLLRVRELVVPFGAILTAMLIVWASVHLLPRRAPDAFSSIALEGTWALTARAVPANPSRDVEVLFRVENATRGFQDYEVTAGIVDGPQWTGATNSLAPGEVWVGKVAGLILDDSCRSRLEIDMNVVGDPTDHFPLAIFFRDNTIRC